MQSALRLHRCPLGVLEEALGRLLGPKPHFLRRKGAHIRLEPLAHRPLLLGGNGGRALGAHGRPGGGLSGLTRRMHLGGESCELGFLLW